MPINFPRGCQALRKCGRPRRRADIHHVKSLTPHLNAPKIYGQEAHNKPLKGTWSSSFHARRTRQGEGGLQQVAEPREIMDTFLGFFLRFSIPHSRTSSRVCEDLCDHTGHTARLSLPSPHSHLPLSGTESRPASAFNRSNNNRNSISWETTRALDFY